MQQRALLRYVVNGYSLALVGWWLARLVYADQIWWLALLNTGALALFVPLPFLLAAALLARSWRLTRPLLLPLALFGLLYGPLFVPRLVALPAAHGSAVKVMTFNVLYRTNAPDQLIAAVDEIQPDLLGLQELTPQLAQQLVPLLQSRYPFHAFDIDGPEAGVGLFSRYPLLRHDTFPLPPRNHALRAVVDVGGTAITVIVAHLSSNRAFNTAIPELPEVTSAFYRHALLEVADLLAALPPAPEPALVLCDCNLTDSSAAYDRLAQTLDDSFWAAGWGLGLTFKLAGLPFPTQRLDYIWHGAAFVASAASVGPPGGSDHLPVVAHLLLKP